MFCLSGFKVAADYADKRESGTANISLAVIRVNPRDLRLDMALPFPFYISRRSRLDDKVSGILL
jgi:hypothetical protein